MADSSPPKQAQNDLQFEQALKRLEDIVERLDAGELSLEDSLRVFEEGMELAQHCQQELDQAQLTVDKLLQKRKDSAADQLNLEELNDDRE